MTMVTQGQCHCC